MTSKKQTVFCKCDACDHNKGLYCSLTTININDKGKCAKKCIIK
jgi:hypothetical protein